MQHFPTSASNENSLKGNNNIYRNPVLTLLDFFIKRDLKDFYPLRKSNKLSKSKCKRDFKHFKKCLKSLLCVVLNC